MYSYDVKISTSLVKSIYNKSTNEGTQKIDLSKYPNNLELATRINKMVKHPKKFLKTSRLMLL